MNTRNHQLLVGLRDKLVRALQQYRRISFKPEFFSGFFFTHAFCQLLIGLIELVRALNWDCKGHGFESRFSGFIFTAAL